MVSRGIWDTASDISKFTKISRTAEAASDVWGVFEISRAGIYPKYPEETVLFPVILLFFYTMETGIIFTCKYLKFGFNTNGLSQSHFRNLSACSITLGIVLLLS